MDDRGKATIDAVDYFWGWSLDLLSSCYFHKLVNSSLACVNKAALCFTGCLKSHSSRGKTNRWALETGYREQWDHRGHLHWMQWIFLDLFKPLDVKVLKTRHPGNVFSNLLGTVSHLVSVAGTAGPSSGSHLSAAWGYQLLGSPGAVSQTCCCVQSAWCFKSWWLCQPCSLF